MTPETVGQILWQVGVLFLGIGSCVYLLVKEMTSGYGTLITNLQHDGIDRDAKIRVLQDKTAECEQFHTMVLNTAETCPITGTPGCPMRMMLKKR